MGGTKNKKQKTKNKNKKRKTKTKSDRIKPTGKFSSSVSVISFKQPKTEDIQEITDRTQNGLRSPTLATSHMHYSYVPRAPSLTRVTKSYLLALGTGIVRSPTSGKSIIRIPSQRFGPPAFLLTLIYTHSLRKKIPCDTSND